MRNILVLGLVVILAPGVMTGCSKKEQPVQEQPDVAVQKSLQDMVTQVDLAQKAADEAKSKAEEAVEVAQAKTAEVVSDMKDQLQDVSALSDALTTDVASAVPSTDIGAAELAGEVPAVPAVPGQAAVESAVADAASDATQVVSEAGAVVADAGAAAAEGASGVVEEAGASHSDEVASGVDAAAALANTTSDQI